MKHLFLIAALLFAAPAFAGNDNANPCGNNGNNCNQGGGSNSAEGGNGYGGDGGTGIGVGVGVGIAQGGAAAATGGAGGNAYGAGGAGGSVLGSGNSSNMNSNVAKGGDGGSAIQGQQQGQGQDQLQGQQQSNVGVNSQGQTSSTSTQQSQAATATNAGNSQNVGGQSTSITLEDVANAPPVFLGNMTATMSCAGSFNAGGSSQDGAGALGFTWVSADCKTVVAGHNMAAIGLRDVACEVYKTTDGYKRAAKANPALASIDCSRAK